MTSRGDRQSPHLGEHCIGVGDGTAGDIHEQRAIRHARQEGCIDHVARGVIEGYGDDDDVCFGEQHREFVTSVDTATRRATHEVDLTLEALKTSRERLRDAPGADDEDTLVRECVVAGVDEVPGRHRPGLSSIRRSRARMRPTASSAVLASWTPAALHKVTPTGRCETACSKPAVGNWHTSRAGISDIALKAHSPAM